MRKDRLLCDYGDLIQSMSYIINEYYKRKFNRNCDIINVISKVFKWLSKSDTDL